MNNHFKIFTLIGLFSSLGLHSFEKNQSDHAGVLVSKTQGVHSTLNF